MAFFNECGHQAASDKTTCSRYQDSHKVPYIMQSGKMRITVLGCGTSTGVPLIHCACKVCRSKNPKNKRLRASIWVSVGGRNLLIDVSPDFRQQMLRTRIPEIDAILITHPHIVVCCLVEIYRQLQQYTQILLQEVQVCLDHLTNREMTPCANE